MAYTALYRNFRPLKFEDMVGQEHITKTLKKYFKKMLTVLFWSDKINNGSKESVGLWKLNMNE